MENRKLESLSFKARSGPIAASMISTSRSTDEMAVVYPGAGYSCKMPLLYYSIELLLAKGYRVLAFDKLYVEDSTWREFQTREAAFKYVEDDSVEVMRQIDQRSTVKVLLGRSLGTFQIACILESGLVRPRQIVWQCPSLYEKWPVIQGCGVASFGIIGTADERYETALPFLPADRLIVEGADHGMELPGDSIRSIDVLKSVMLATDGWLLQASRKT